MKTSNTSDNFNRRKIVESTLHSTRSIKDFKTNPDKMLSQLRRSRKPLLLVKNGKPQAWLLDARKLSKKNSMSEFERLIEEAEADVAAGRVEDCDQYIKRLFDAYNLL